MLAKADDPLFYLPECTVLTRQAFVSRLKTLLSMLGYNDVNFSGHSLRRGFATSASAANIQDHVIASLGRWSSDCYKTYIDLPKVSVASTHRTLAALL